MIRPLPKLSDRQLEMLDVYIQHDGAPVTPDQVRDALGLKKRPLQPIKDLVMEDLIEWVDRAKVVARITERGRRSVSEILRNRAALQGNPDDPHDDITDFQLAILRAMATDPPRRWHAEELAKHMPGGDIPTRPSLRRLVWKDLVCTESPSLMGERRHWLTIPGMIRATGEVRNDLPDPWTPQNARQHCESLSTHGFHMLRAMITSEHKDWSLSEMDSVMALGLHSTREGAAELQRLGLAVASSNITLRLTNLGFLVGTGRAQISFVRVVANAASALRSGAEATQSQPSRPAPARAMSTAKIMLTLLAAMIIGVVCLGMAIKGCSKL